MDVVDQDAGVGALGRKRQDRKPAARLRGQAKDLASCGQCLGSSNVGRFQEPACGPENQQQRERLDQMIEGIVVEIDRMQTDPNLLRA